MSNTKISFAQVLEKSNERVKMEKEAVEAAKAEIDQAKLESDRATPEAADNHHDQGVSR